MMRAFGLLLISTFLAASSYADSQSPKSLECEVKDSNRPGLFDKLSLQQNENGTYTLKYSGVMKISYRKFQVDETILARNLNCAFGGPTSQLISCSESEYHPVNSDIRGPSGTIEHTLSLIKIATTSVNSQSQIESRERSEFTYSRMQQIWAASIEFSGHYIDRRPDPRDGESQKAVLDSGTLKVRVGADCFKY